jgi:hypothetical protein
MKSTVHLLYYVAETFSEWEIFQWNFVEKNKTHILCSDVFFNSRRLWQKVEIFCRAG